MRASTLHRAGRRPSVLNWIGVVTLTVWVYHPLQTAYMHAQTAPAHVKQLKQATLLIAGSTTHIAAET